MFRTLYVAVTKTICKICPKRINVAVFDVFTDDGIAAYTKFSFLVLTISPAMHPSHTYPSCPTPTAFYIMTMGR